MSKSKYFRKIFWNKEDVSIPTATNAQNNEKFRKAILTRWWKIKDAINGQSHPETTFQISLL